MKHYREWPIDGRPVEAPVGSYLVVLDEEHGVATMRLHRRKVVTAPDGSKIRTYDIVYAHDLSVVQGGYSHGAQDYYIQEGTDAFTRLEPFMNLMGTRQAESYCPAFVVSEEELRGILGIGDGNPGES